MKKYVALHFLPGAGGNFISRCINLLENTYVWSNAHTLTLEKKLELFSYNDWKTDSDGNWIAFEHKLLHYNSSLPHRDIDKDGVAVFITHPQSLTWIGSKYAGIDDLALNVYIDCKEVLKWCIINASFKNSFQTVPWFNNAEIIENNDTIFKINLKTIIESYEGFFTEFSRLALYLDRTIGPLEEAALHTLYNQWKTTWIPDDRIVEAKQGMVEILTKLLNCLNNEGLK